MSEAGTNFITKEWKSAVIYDGIKSGNSKLPSIDPFNDIAPLAVSSNEIPNDKLVGVSDYFRERERGRERERERESYLNEIV